MDSFFSEADLDKSGCITLDEFTNWVLGRKDIADLLGHITGLLFLDLVTQKTVLFCSLMVTNTNRSIVADGLVEK